MRPLSWLAALVLATAIAGCSSGDVVSPADVASADDTAVTDNGASDSTTSDAGNADTCLLYTSPSPRD